MKCVMLLVTVLSAMGPAAKSAGEKPFPIRMVIPAKCGGVVFFHFQHAQRANFYCSTCHATLWPQDTNAPLKFRRPEGHQAAESDRASCGSCHRSGGSAFSTEGNCGIRCHSTYAGSKPAAKGD